MKWMDPLSVTCKQCGATDDYAVEQLKDLSAVCFQCGKSLSYVGQNMLEEERRLSAQVQIIELLLDIEDRLNIEYGDEEIEPIENLTICKIVELTEAKLRDDPTIHDIVVEAMGRIFSNEEITIDENFALYQSFMDKRK